MLDKVLYDASQSGAPDVSIIFLDWSCRESFHSLDYLSSQSVSRDRYEIIWIEYYGRVSPEIKDGLEKANTAGKNPLLDKWIVLGYPDNVYYHKHLMYNAGIAVSKGKIICICDSDAIFSPTFVETIINFFSQNQNVVLHMDEVRNIDRRFYPFNHPTVEEIIKEGCINWKDGKTTGILDHEDPLHTRNYGACMCALREDLIAIGGADEHIDYLGHICGPYELTFRLINAGKIEIWHEEEYLYHAWHPGTDGRGNYLGPHDGRNMSSTALEVLDTGRVMPLEENPAIKALRLGTQKGLTEKELINLSLREEKIKQWTIDENDYNLALGKEAYNRGDYDGAISYWQKVLANMPADSDLLSELGWACYLKSNHVEAQKAFDQAIKIDSKGFRSLSGLGWLYFQKSDFEKSIRNFTLAIENAPPKKKELLEETYRGRGWSLFHKGYLKEAEEDFIKAVENADERNRGSLQDLYRGLGWVCIRNNEYGRAVEFFKKAIDNIDKENKAILEDAERGLKQAHGALGEVACAGDKGHNVTVCKSVTENIPTDIPTTNGLQGINDLGALKSDLWSKLGWAYYLKSNYNDALNSFNNALILNAVNYRALNGRGWACMQKGLLDSAVEDFTSALYHANPVDKDSIQEIARGRAWTYLNKGDMNRALSDFEKAIENTDMSNKNVLRELYKGKSIAHLRAGNTEQAISSAVLSGEFGSGGLLRLRIAAIAFRAKRIIKRLFN